LASKNLLKIACAHVCVCVWWCWCGDEWVAGGGGDGVSSSSAQLNVSSFMGQNQVSVFLSPVCVQNGKLAFYL